MADRSRKLYKTVAATSEEVDSVTIPNRQTFELRQWVLSASPLKDTQVSVVFDYLGANETILAMTHGTLVHDFVKKVTGDGIKKLAIILKNDSGGPVTLGAQFSARDI